VLVEDGQIVERAGALGELFRIAVQAINPVRIKAQFLPIRNFSTEVWALRADCRSKAIKFGFGIV